MSGRRALSGGGLMSERANVCFRYGVACVVVVMHCVVVIVVLLVPSLCEQ